MERLLFLGGSGFVGRNILPSLQKHYEVIAPCRDECNITDAASVNAYFQKHSFSILIHSANTNPVKNTVDNSTTFFSDTLRGYFTIARHANKFKRVFYFGSGAEYNKTKPIVNVTEEEIGTSIPVDEYGFAKYIINQTIVVSENSYNMRLFGCYGPNDAKTKFIRDCIDACLEERDITIRQNCMFDYLFVHDIVPILKHFIEYKPEYHDYNICSGRRIDLYSIATMVKELMHSSSSIVIAKDGWNNEYTASNARMLKECKNLELTTLEQGILQQIEWQKTL